jgi:hypothetical protein
MNLILKLLKNCILLLLMNDMYAQSYLNEVDDPINPDDIDEDLLLDDIVSIISRGDTFMRSILVAYANLPRPTKKIKIPRVVNPRKTSLELWNSIWANVFYPFVKR